MEGWARSAYSKYHHYFVSRVPLCNRCGLPDGDIVQGNDDSDDNCPICKDRLKDRRIVLIDFAKQLVPFAGSEVCTICHKPCDSIYKGICQSCRLRKTWEK